MAAKQILMRKIEVSLRVPGCGVSALPAQGGAGGVVFFNAM